MAYRWTLDDLRKTPAGQRALTNIPVPAASAAPQPKRQKFLNVKTTDMQGIVHDGKGECERWQELQLLERGGSIRALRRQVPYALVVNGLLVATYFADFVYLDGEATIVEDHKSPRTRKLKDFRMKVKLMQALHGIQIREVTK
jgi:hypothetical protein